MDSKINIYFEATWNFRDSRLDRPPHIFHVEFYRDALDCLPDMENEYRRDLNITFFSALEKEFPEFNDKEFKITSLDCYGEKVLLDKRREGCNNLMNIIAWNEKSAFIMGSKPIPLRIEQRLFSVAESSTIDDEKPVNTTENLIPRCSDGFHVFVIKGLENTSNESIKGTSWIRIPETQTTSSTSALGNETVESVLSSNSVVQEAPILPIENSNPSLFSLIFNIIIIMCFFYYLVPWLFNYLIPLLFLFCSFLESVISSFFYE